MTGTTHNDADKRRQTIEYASPGLLERQDRRKFDLLFLAAAEVSAVAAVWTSHFRFHLPFNDDLPMLVLPGFCFIVNSIALAVAIRRAYDPKRLPVISLFDIVVQLTLMSAAIASIVTFT